ncbi:hypothetical protein LCGC14_1131440 [marine sediment metagenome]|uniref:Uncharacterized protein n=1 Tax=marine sediment metagenome TaxID=412755 RepID=A0A0F9M0X8_9ZZZZ
MTDETDRLDDLARVLELFKRLVLPFLAQQREADITHAKRQERTRIIGLVGKHVGCTCARDECPPGQCGGCTTMDILNDIDPEDEG